MFFDESFMGCDEMMSVNSDILISKCDDFGGDVVDNIFDELTNAGVLVDDFASEYNGNNDAVVEELKLRYGGHNDQ